MDLSEEKKEEVLNLLLEGYKGTEVMRMTGVSKYAVYNIKHKALAVGLLKPGQKKPGQDSTEEVPEGMPITEEPKKPKLSNFRTPFNFIPKAGYISRY